METLVNNAGLELVGSEGIMHDDLESGEATLVEAVVTANSLLVGETAFSLDLCRQHGVNPLAVARQSHRLRTRLDQIRLRVGDVLLLECPVQRVKDVLTQLGCLLLAQRDLRLGQPERIVQPIAIFGAALLLSAVGVIPIQIAFVAAVVMLITGKLVFLREAYHTIDWLIIVLVGAMIPVGEALETTDAAELVANEPLQIGGQLSATAILAIVLVVTMFLSDLLNNAAAVVLTAPIGISVAQGFNASAPPS